MKPMPAFPRSLPRGFAAALTFTLLALWAAPHARADVEITRCWAATAPVIDGVVSAGEWNSATATTISSGGINYAQMRTMNDGSYLYVLLDVYRETVNDPMWQSASSPGDYYYLYIDKDLNYAVTPNVDFFYSPSVDGRVLVKSVMLSQTSWTGVQAVNTNSLGARGFGTSFNSSVKHRIYEFRLSLSELGVNTSTWTTSSGSVPKVRMDVLLVASNPSFTVSQPDPSATPNFSLMYQVDLATSPSFPAGSTGPVFAGVGLVPSSYIDASGHANINISGYYSATNAPFGGSLNVFGNWTSLLSDNATRYQVLYSKNGGPFTPLKQTWTNFELTNSTWVPVAVGPDANNSYPIPSPAQTWYLPNLLISWQTAAGFGDGTYTLALQLLNASGNQLASPRGNSLTLLVDNTAPTVTIGNAFYDGTAICECGIVTAGPCVVGLPPHLEFNGLTFDLTVNDPEGALNGYSLDYTYGNNQGGNIFSDTYAPNHVNASGPEQWDGVTNESEPGAPFCAPASCAYTFVLSASSRIQNGYGLVYPYVSYSKSLTILLSTTGAGSINCP
jgi:hypothetical protein